jgi:acylphosphatase
LRVYISGKVQGVSFRGFARRCAAELGLTGWVRNLYDGRVEVLAEGERLNLEVLSERLKIGPSSARVDKLDVGWESYTGEFPDFKVAWLDF